MKYFFGLFLIIMNNRQFTFHEVYNKQFNEIIGDEFTSNNETSKKKNNNLKMDDPIIKKKQKQLMIDTIKEHYDISWEKVINFCKIIQIKIINYIKNTKYFLRINFGILLLIIFFHFRIFFKTYY